MKHGTDWSEKELNVKLVNVKKIIVNSSLCFLYFQFYVALVVKRRNR